MDNNAFKVCEEVRPKDPSSNKGAVITNDPNVMLKNEIQQNSDSNEYSSVCCCGKRKALKLAGTSAAFKNEDEKNPRPPPNRYRRSFAAELKSFFDSAIYYVFILIATFVITILLFMELIIDSGAFKDPSVPLDPAKQHDVESISTAMHWFSFAILTLFFLEIFLRIAVMRLSIVYDYICVCDCTVIFIAFVSNLCVTLILGPLSPIDAISLIVILRFMRIYSLIRVKMNEVKTLASLRIESCQQQIMTASDTISTLQRQILNKDFEIKQLHAYLSDSSAMDDPQIRAAVELSKKGQSKIPSADAELEMAIALSKQTYNEENNICEISPTDIGKFALSEEPDDLDVLVHSRPRDNAAKNSITPSVLDEYFHKPEADALPQGTPGAIRKIKHPKTKCSAGSNNDHILSPLSQPILCRAESKKKEPESICIDPKILDCEDGSENKSDGEMLSVSNHQVDSMSFSNGAETSVKIKHPTTAKPDIKASSSISASVSSDECSHASPKNIHKLIPNSLSKHSGSSLGSESGYHSEDSNGVVRHKLSLLNGLPNDAINRAITDEIIQLDDL